MFVGVGVIQMLVFTVVLLLQPHQVLSDVLQQYLETRTVQEDALADPDFPSAAGTTNDQPDRRTWTNNNQNVRLDTTVTIEFNENIQVGYGYITFQPPINNIGTSSSAATTIAVPSSDVVATGNTLVLNSNPRVADVFEESTVYTVSFDAGVVEDLDVPADTNSAFSVQFTTGDFTAPTLTAASPADDAPAVDIGSDIVLTFSEAVQANSVDAVSITVKDFYERQTPFEYNPACSDAAVVISGNTVTVDLGASTFPLLPCQKYQVVYSARCFYDTSPNHNWVASLPSLSYHDFWTSCIVAYSPVQSSLDNLISTNIVLTFSEAVLPGSGDIVVTPLGETPQNFGVASAGVSFDAATNQVTVIGSVGPTYLCQSLTMQNCKGKPMDVSIGLGVIHRADTSSPAPSLAMPEDLTEQLSGSSYRFTMKPADLTPPVITVVSMYGISESVIRITIRLDESGTTYCRAYESATFVPVSQGGSDVPTLTDCVACTKEIKSDTDPNFVGDSLYDTVKKFAEHEVDVTGLTDKTMYWVYCYSHDIEIPNVNVVTSTQMLATERQVRTLDTTPPTFLTFTCVPTPGLEDSVTVTLSMNEAGRAYCKVVNRGFTQPSPNAVIAEGFYADVLDTSSFNITVNQVTTGLGATGMEALFRKTDYDIYCWSQDAEGYPYHGPNGMASAVACPDNHVTTLDRTRPNMRFVMAESISNSQILIKLQVDEGARVWCAAWDTDPLITNGDYVSKIKAKETDCMDNKGRQCGTFWIYDLDDLEDTAADLVDTRAQYDSSENWKYNQDFDIIVYNLVEKTDYPYIYCYAEDDEQDGLGGAPNQMQFDAAANAGPDNVHTIAAGIPTVQTLDESPPSFTQLSMLDPTADNDRIVVTFSLNEAGTAYCRVTRSDSGETTLRINRILTANYGASVVAAGDLQYITIDKLESRDSAVLYEATQYDVYCWALDSAVDTQGQPRPNYMLQDYVDTDVAAMNAPLGGKTLSVWVKDMTPPQLIYISSEALSQEIIQITLQLNEPGTVWCQPVFPALDTTFVDKDDVTSTNYESYIKGRSGMATFREYVHQSFINVDVEVDKVERDDGTFAVALSQETPYNIFCFAEDDWAIEAVNAGSRSINFNHVTNNVGPANEITFAWAENFQTRLGLVTTLDLTPPSITVTDVTSDETVITVTLRLDETGTAWCQAVRKDFNVPTILEILDTNFYNTYTYSLSSPNDVINVTLTGYDRPKNYNNSYVTPLVLGTDYDVYCYADDDLCQGCKVTNGVSSSHVEDTKQTIRTKDYTRPNMRFVAAESIAADQIHITLQVDEGSKVWCAAWSVYPGLTSLDYETRLKAYSPACHDNKGRECGQFWVYDLDDLEDGMADGLDSRADYDSDVNWKYNQDVDIILSQLTEETDYPFIYCYAEDDEAPPNKMLYSVSLGDAGPDNVYTMGQEIGTIQTLDESPPSFTYLAMLDPTADNNSIVVTFQLNEAGTTYCRVTRSDSGETTLRINQILSANYAAEVTSPTATGYITVDKLESRDPPDMTLYQATQYDVYCWAKDSAVDTQNQPRPNYMQQAYLEAPSVSITAPEGGKTASVWVKDTTPPTLIYVSSEALTDTTIQITLQLDEPGTVWCHPVVPTSSGAYASAYVDVDDVASGTYIQYIKGRSASFMKYVPIPHINVDVEVDQLDQDDGLGSALLLKETPYNIYCFAEDDWKIEAQYSAAHSQNFAIVNAATPSMTVGDGNEITMDVADNFKDAVGIVTTLDLTPPSITITSIFSDETTIVVTLRLDETGTAWCQAVRKGFNVPTILEILDTNFFNTYTYNVGSPNDVVNVTLTGYDRPKNYDNSYLTPLVLGTDYDVYCYADDDLCQGCKVTNGVSSSHVENTMTEIRTKDYTRPNMRFVAAESIAHDQILVTLQVDEGSKVWCAAWSSDPSLTNAVDAETAIKGKETDCKDGKGRQCGTFWIYDLDDLEDGASDLVESRAEYDDPQNWKYNQDVDIIMYGLTEELDYPYIYCFAEDDETIPNKMMFDSVANAGPNNMHTMQTEIGTVQTLDESPPSFTRLALQDPTAVNDRLVVTFQLNEAGTAYCRTTRSDSGETTLRINQILTANYGAEVLLPSDTAYITIDKLEYRDTASLYEAAQYNIYCWAKDSAVDTQGLARPNYMLQSYVDTPVGADTAQPSGGFTANVWITDSTPPTIIVVSSEALAEDVIQVTLQLNEPGTIWCQIADKDSSPHTLTPGGLYCRDMDVSQTVSDPCYFETWIKGTTRPSGSTTFRADVHTPYRDHDIDMNLIEKVTPTQEGRPLLAQYHYNVWCFAEDDWRWEAEYAPSPSPIFAAPAGPNLVQFPHTAAVRSAIGQILTLDQTPPSWTSISGTQYAESILTVTMTLDELGTIWCMPVRSTFAEPSINEILQNAEYNANCGPTPDCTVQMIGLQSKTLYDIWCYAEDDNEYPQRPNGRKFSSLEVVTLSTLDTTPPILTIVSAESPISTDIRIKVRMEEPGTVFCNSFPTGTAYGSVDFDAVVAAGFESYVGLPGQTPGGPINTNVEVIVTGLIEQTQYDTYCTAQDTSTLLSINKLEDATTLSTMPAIGQITTLDQSPPTFTVLGAKGTAESTIMVTFRCNEACRAYCRVTRSDSGETSLSINRILKADYQADHVGGTAADQTIQLSRLEDDSSLQLLERGTLYDTYCWIRDEAVQHSCYASGAGAVCETFPKPNYQGQTYVDTAFGGTPPATMTSPLGGKILHVRTPDTTPPNVIFIEAESTEETSITVTLQLDEPGTAYCKAYTTTQGAAASLYTDLTAGAPVFKNTVTNWNNIYKNFEVKVSGLSMETKYYVYCTAEDDELVEGATTIDPQPTENNPAAPMLTESTGRFTLDLTPPMISVASIASMSETTSTVTLQLDEPGTAWCKAVRDRFDAPSINQIIAASFSAETLSANQDFTVRVENLQRDTEYDVYCHARDRGTEVDGIAPSAGNPGNDAAFDHVLTTKRDIHTMGDSTPPTVVSVTPVYQETSVDVNPVFRIVFNEDIQAGTGNINFESEGGLVIPLDITQANTGSCEQNFAQLLIILNTFTADFSPCAANQLQDNTRYYVYFTAGVMKDSSYAANSVPAFGSSNSYYFTTGTSR